MDVIRNTSENTRGKHPVGTYVPCKAIVGEAATAGEQEDALRTLAHITLNTSPQPSELTVFRVKRSYLSELNHRSIVNLSVTTTIY